MDGDANFRSRLLEHRDGGRQEIVGERGRRRDLDRADRGGAHVVDEAVDPVDAVEHALEIVSRAVSAVG